MKTPSTHPVQAGLVDVETQLFALLQFAIDPSASGLVAGASASDTVPKIAPEHSAADALPAQATIGDYAFLTLDSSRTS